MPTVYNRLTLYQESHPVQPLNHLQKSQLGRLISSAWFKQAVKPKLYFIKSVEDTGTFMVIVYPDDFCATIDLLIAEFYRSITKRKRIKIKTAKKEWSCKPSNNNE